MLKKFSEVYDCDSITINISNACNLNCEYCFEKNKDGKKMDLQTAIDIVEASYKKITNSSTKFTVNLFGGEPFTNWEVIKGLIDYTNSKNYFIQYATTTNLTIMNDEILEYIDDNGILLLVSIDGIPKVHNENRSNSYDIVEKNIKLLKENGCSSLIEARMTIPSNQVKYMYDGIKHIYDLGINNICPMPVTDMEWSEEEINEYRNQYKKVLKFYLDVMTDKSNNRNIYIKHVDEMLSDVLSDIVIDGRMCNIGGNKWCAFDIDGDIYQCHQMNYYNKNLSIGNIYTGIDESKMIKEDELIFDFLNTEECKKCIAKPICNSGCPSENKINNGDMHIPTKAYCEICKIHIEEAKKCQSKLSQISEFKSRLLNMTKENLKLKDYLDNIIKKGDMDSPEFDQQMFHFQEMINELLDQNLILPRFEQYIINVMTVLFTNYYNNREVFDNGSI